MEEERSSGSGGESLCVKSPTEFAKEYFKRTSSSSSSSSSTPSLPLVSSSSLPLEMPPLNALLVYDAVWTVAVATASARSFPDQPLVAAIAGVSLTGVSGPISFSHGARVGPHPTLLQYREVGDVLKAVPVAHLTPNNATLTYVEGEGRGSVWPGGVPSDGSPVQVEHYPIPALMAMVYLYICLGVTLSVACLIFNIVYRKKKLVRLTSPNLNNIIVLGAIILYLAGLTFYYPRGASTAAITWGCNLRAWSVSLGYSICYGTINVKMWRVFMICHNPKPTMKKTLLKDWHLTMIVLLFVLVDTIILTVVMAIDNSRFSVTTIPNKEDPSPRVNEEGIKEKSVVSRCYSPTEPFWLSLLFGYKIVIQVIGIVFAFKIRKVKIKGLNDSKEVAAILYITSVILAVILISNFVFGDYIDVDAFVYGMGLSTAVTIVLLFTFIPKVVGLYRDPKGERLFHAPASTPTAPTSDPSEVVFLQKRIRDLEKRVELARSQENLLSLNLSNPVFECTDSKHSDKTPPTATPTSLPLSPTTTCSNSTPSCERSPNTTETPSSSE